MALFLAEYRTEGRSREALTPLLDGIAAQVKQSGGEVIEVQLGAESQRAYLIAEHNDQAALSAALTGDATPISPLAEVRLVGAQLDDVKAARGGANYLVEWDLPEGLPMEKYLERKRNNSPKYAEVPEVKFLRTYVREDMMKCLCFYEAPDEDAVRRAREAVSAPIDRLSRLDG